MAPFTKKRSRLRASRRRAEKPRVRTTLPPLRELPASVKNRKPGEIMTNAQHIDMLQWLLDCLDDSARAAGLRVERAS